MAPRTSSALLAALALALVAGAGAVQLEVFTHPGCPLGRRFITRMLNKTLLAPGIAEILNLEYSPIGRAYYPTTTCGNDRKCFLNECGNGKSREQRPLECFSGDMLCEGDQKECTVTRSLACVKSLADTGLQFMRINHCVAEVYHLYDDGGVSVCSDYFKLGQKAHSSQNSSSSSTELLVNCHNSVEGDEAILNEMAIVPAHVESPLVRVDGEPLENIALRAADPSYLLKAICGAFAVSHQDEIPPDACQGGMQSMALASSETEAFQKGSEASTGSEPHVVTKSAGASKLLRGAKVSLLATDVETTTLVLR